MDSAARQVVMPWAVRSKALEAAAAACMAGGARSRRDFCVDDNNVVLMLWNVDMSHSCWTDWMERRASRTRAWRAGSSKDCAWMSCTWHRFWLHLECAVFY